MVKPCASPQLPLPTFYGLGKFITLFINDPASALTSIIDKRNEGRIAHGVEVEPKFKYPFAVRIWNPLKTGGKNSSICAGTVLNREWILTAGHCVRRAGDFHVFTVGDHNIHEKEENEQDLRAKEIIMHEGYRSVV